MDQWPTVSSISPTPSISPAMASVTVSNEGTKVGDITANGKIQEGSSQNAWGQRKDWAQVFNSNNTTTETEHVGSKEPGSLTVILPAEHVWEVDTELATTLHSLSSTKALSELLPRFVGFGARGKLLHDLRDRNTSCKTSNGLVNEAEMPSGSNGSVTSEIQSPVTSPYAYRFAYTPYIPVATYGEMVYGPYDYTFTPYGPYDTTQPNSCNQAYAYTYMHSNAIAIPVGIPPTENLTQLSLSPEPQGSPHNGYNGKT